MLKYFIMTTETLLSASVMTGLMLSWLKLTCGKKQVIPGGAGAAAGLLCAVVMSFLKNTTNWIDTGLWNLRIFAVSLAALILFFVFTGLGKKWKKTGTVLSAAMLAVLICTALLYALPDVLAYPYSILMTEKTVLSTAFLFKLIGIILGILLVILTGLALYQGAVRLEKGTVLLLMSMILITNAVRQAAMCLRIMLAKRMIESTHTLFAIAKFSSNHEDVFIYVTAAAAAVIPVILWIRSFLVREPYGNPAEHRKIRAKWRKIRRWSSAALICLLLAILDMTALRAISEKEIELSPVEEVEVADGNIYVSFDQVADGHLHRFGYVTENNVEIRFIVIKKPNSSSYGIGLDACDICGETGYYEKDGQVVCKLCDVVMNINTIGFKGGCNPIVIDYSIENGNIVVPVEGLIEHESEFK